MKLAVRNITSNLFLDNFLINFPLWFPLCYIFLALNFPNYRNLLFIFTLFLFAETHFASTWLFFFDRQNWFWVKNNLYQFFVLPIYCFILICLTWFFSPSLVIVLHYLASGWHVTKQSTGILKIYGANQRIYQFLVYFFSFSCLGIGLNSPGILSRSLNSASINLYLMFFLIIYISILLLSLYGKLSKKIIVLFPVITGLLIYIPILFFENLAIATAVGVGMHWCQYIAIMWSMYFRKNKKNSKINPVKNIKNVSRVSFVFIYAFIMTVLAVLGMPDFKNGSSQYSYLYLIPLLFQLYHFYIDGFIWKFSDPHIKKSVLPYIFKNPV